MNVPTESPSADLVIHRFGPDGLYLLDEPEAALSVRGCLATRGGPHTLADAFHNAVCEGRLPGPGDIRWLT